MNAGEQSTESDEREHLRREYNAAMANSLIRRAKRIERQLKALQDTDHIVVLLAEHSPPSEVLHALGDAWGLCGCGERFDLTVADGKISTHELAGRWRSHVAEEIVAALRSSPAEVAATCACGALTLVTTASERHDRGLHGPDYCVGALPWGFLKPNTCEAVTLAGLRCTNPGGYEHRVHAGRRVCGHHHSAPFLITPPTKGGDQR